MQAISDFCITHSRTNLDGIIIIIGGDQDFNLDLLAARNGYLMHVEMFYNPYGIANSHLEGAADESHSWFDFLAKSLERHLPSLIHQGREVTQGGPKYIAFRGRRSWVSFHSSPLKLQHSFKSSAFKAHFAVCATRTLAPSEGFSSASCSEPMQCPCFLPLASIRDHRSRSAKTMLHFRLFY
jgi:hypothetical protein